MNALREDHPLSKDRLTADVTLWRKIAFCLPGAFSTSITALVVCAVIDIILKIQKRSVSHGWTFAARSFR
jgi:hypothetical protein